MNSLVLLERRQSTESERIISLLPDFHLHTRTMSTCVFPIEETVVFKNLRETSSEMFMKMTNFAEHELVSLLGRLQPFCIEPPRKGRSVKLHWVDSCIIQLMYYKMYPNLTDFARDLKISTVVLKNSIDKYRDIFNQFLKSEWLQMNIRPTKNNHELLNFIGGCYDHSCFEIPKPMMSFSCAKRFWNQKFHMYALKKGVLVSPVTGYALFVSKSVEGAVHDYEDFKNTYHPLVTFLKKTEDEKSMFQNDANAHWAISMDKGYIGPEEDSPGIRKITFIKQPRTVDENLHNLHLSRVHNVEHFFGRLKKKWKITSSVYRNSKEYFDHDIDNCILLTNEDIRFRKLIQEDMEYFTATLLNQYHQFQTDTKKRKEQYEKYRNAKKARLSLADLCNS